MARRLGRGERQVGMKMGFTSRAKMLQMGIDDLIWGRLTSGMRVEEGSTIKLSSYVHPRVEPEIAFLLKRPLAGDVTASEALAAVEAIAPALEIIDSRYQNFKFSLPDVIADNASSSGFVIGAWNAPNSDIGNLGMVMSFDGKAQHMGSSAAILGNPLRALPGRVAGTRYLCAPRRAAPWQHRLSRSGLNPCLSQSSTSSKAVVTRRSRR